MSKRTKKPASLFIGGSHDGARYPIGGDWVRFPVRVTASIQHAAEQRLKVKYEDYCPMKSKGEETPFFVYVLEGMSRDEVMRRLIENYNTKLSHKEFERVCPDCDSGDIQTFTSDWDQCKDCGSLIHPV